MSAVDDRVLIIEGDPDEERLILHHLLKEKMPGQVKLITDGQLAWEHLENQETKSEELVALFLDLNLTTLSALELLRKVRADPRLRHLHVVVMTASNSPDDLAECRRLGVFSFVKKPITLASFTKAIADSFHDSRALPKLKR